MTSKIKFTEGPWTATINVADFVYRNIVPYEGDASFLMGPSDRTNKLWQECIEALEEEREWIRLAGCIHGTRSGYRMFWKIRHR